MKICECILAVAACGAMGGVAACINKDVVFLPQFDRNSRAWRPGALGTIFIGAFAAWSVWSLYSQSGLLNIGGDATPAISLTMRELGSMGIIGFSGGKVLNLLAQQEANIITKNKLTNVNSTLLDIAQKE
jgi:hypothetical protein